MLSDIDSSKYIRGYFMRTKGTEVKLKCEEEKEVFVKVITEIFKGK